MHMKALCAVLFMGLLAACAQVPRPSTYPYSLQQQMQAAEHWQALAVKMVENLRAGPNPRISRRTMTPPLGKPCAASETELTQRGIPLATTESQGLTLAWDVQPVPHAGWRYKPHLPFLASSSNRWCFSSLQAWQPAPYRTMK